MSELANPTLPAPNTTATGWIKLAPNSKRDFIACFTTSDKVIYTFIGSLSKDVELVSNSATLGYDVASDDLNGTHQVNTATVGTNYFNLDLDNGVTIKGKLDVSTSSAVTTAGSGGWNNLGSVHKDTPAPKA